MYHAMWSSTRLTVVVVKQNIGYSVRSVLCRH